MRFVSFAVPSVFLVVLVMAPPSRSADEPAPRFDGFWTWKWEDQDGAIHRHVLNVENTGKKLAASERFDDEKPVDVEELKVKGNEVSFVVPRSQMRALYVGKFASDDTINGEVQVTNAAGQVEKYGWTAKRRLKGEEP